MKNQFVATLASLTVATLTGLAFTPAALADAYMVCESPMLGGVMVSPAGANGNFFSLRLPAIDSVLKPLGLPTTQEYRLTGTFGECTSNPNSAFAAYCDTYTGAGGPVTVIATGLTDHSVTTLSLFGASLNATTDLKTDESATLNYLDVEVDFDLDAQHTVRETFSFGIPLPGAPENSPSQCN